MITFTWIILQLKQFKRQIKNNNNKYYNSETKCFANTN